MLLGKRSISFRVCLKNSISGTFASAHIEPSASSSVSSNPLCFTFLRASMWSPVNQLSPNRYTSEDRLNFFICIAPKNHFVRTKEIR